MPNVCNHVALDRPSRRATKREPPPNRYARGVCGNWRQRAEVTCIALFGVSHHFLAVNMRLCNERNVFIESSRALSISFVETNTSLPSFSAVLAFSRYFLSQYLRQNNSFIIIPSQPHSHRLGGIDTSELPYLFSNLLHHNRLRFFRKQF